MIYKAITLLLIGFYGVSINTSETNKFEPTEISLPLNSSLDLKVESIYQNLNVNNFELPTKNSFSKAMEGYLTLKDKGVVKKEVLTIVDYTLSSNQKRFWVIDLKNNVILFQSFVAHGRNSGGEFAKQFSNVSSSFKSSLGFYATGETYYGKHGYSLRLDGLEKGVNNNARNRAIVMHGADYVSESFIKQNGRLGRSLGCLALSKKLSKEVIDNIKDKSCIFVYYPS